MGPTTTITDDHYRLKGTKNKQDVSIMDAVCYLQACPTFSQPVAPHSRGRRIFATLRVIFESGCPSGSHVAPSGCLSGGMWPPSGSDLALLGSQGGSMGTPKGHYVGHLAPQGVALGHQGVHIWHPGGAMVATWSQDTSLEGPKQ